MPGIHRLCDLLSDLQAAVSNVNYVGVGHAGEEVVQLGRGHHVRRHAAGQAELAAPVGGGGGGGEELDRGSLRDASNEARGDLGAVGGGGPVVNPLPDLW